ncbi:hypothetical protein HanRHA438_Chr05g0237971 [Helianthus annuus]|nr:hypothetical protein HanRHA438_Chr05g0237971 [Helianthus annuus]
MMDTCPSPCSVFLPDLLTLHRHRSSTSPSHIPPSLTTLPSTSAVSVTLSRDHHVLLTAYC